MSKLLRTLPIWFLVAACSGTGSDDSTDPAGDDDDDDDTVIEPTGSTHTADTSAPSCLEGTPSFEIGTGSDTFELLTELAPVEVVFGPQGGYHMLAAVRACHMDTVLTVHLQLTDEATGTVVSDVSYLAPTYDEGDCCRYRADMYGYLDVSQVPGIGTTGAGEYLDGKVVVYTLQVEDAVGNDLTESVRVTASFPSR